MKYMNCISNNSMSWLLWRDDRGRRLSTCKYSMLFTPHGAGQSPKIGRVGAEQYVVVVAGVCPVAAARVRAASALAAFALCWDDTRSGAAMQLRLGDTRSGGGEWTVSGHVKYSLVKFAGCQRLGDQMVEGRSCKGFFMSSSAR